MVDFTHSRWDTTYLSPGGPVRAIVSFNNADGEYDLVDGSGTIVDSGVFSNVKYFVTTPTIWLITGHWTLHGTSGAFQFNAAGGSDDFTGGWLFSPPHPGGGTWNGHRLP